MSMTICFRLTTSSCDEPVSYTHLDVYKRQAVNYFGGSLPSGSCTGMSYQTTFMGRAFNFDASNVLCGSTAASIYTILGLGVMLAAGWVAFRIAIL